MGRALVNAGVCALVRLSGARAAQADGVRVELTALGGAGAPDSGQAAIVGTRLGVGHSFGAFGLFAEGSAVMLPRTAREGSLQGDLAARLRIAKVDVMRTTLSGERGPLALGLELETLIQREWWDLDPALETSARTSFGVGLAGFAVESRRGTRAGIRADLRVLVSPATSSMDVVARSSSPSRSRADQELGIIFAIGTELGTD